MHASYSPAAEATGRLRKREFKNIFCQVRELDRELVTGVFRNLVPETGHMSRPNFSLLSYFSFFSAMLLEGDVKMLKICGNN